jgi:hypothetical protein
MTTPAHPRPTDESRPDGPARAGDGPTMRHPVELEPVDYVISRIHSALTLDPRVHEQGLDVLVSGRRVTLRGEVATESRRWAVLQVAHETIPDAELVDDLRVLSETVTTESEAL